MNDLIKLLTLCAIVILTACGGGAGEVGDECVSDADCADGLECHLHEHEGEEEDHGECEAHDEEEHEDE